MEAIKAEDLQRYVGGHFVRAEHGREFQGRVQAISDIGKGKVEITCESLGEYDPNSRRSIVRTPFPVSYTLDLSRDCKMRNDGSDFYYNPHCNGVCNDVEHLAVTLHLFPTENSIAARVREDAPRRFFTQRRLAAIGFTALVVLAGIEAGRRRRRRRGRKRRQNEEGRDS